MWGQTIYNDRSWETFFQDVGDDGTDISKDIDWWKFECISNLLYHFQNNVIVISMYECLCFVVIVISMYECFCFVVIVISMYERLCFVVTLWMSPVLLLFISVLPSWFSDCCYCLSSIWSWYLHDLLTIFTAYLVTL
jgi:hypothetical protein